MVVILYDGYDKFKVFSFSTGIEDEKNSPMMARQLLWRNHFEHLDWLLIL